MACPRGGAAESGGPAATPWYTDLTPYHWFVFTVASLAWLFDCLDQQLFILARNNALTSLLTTGGQSPAPEVVKLYGGYATSIFVAGWALGGLFQLDPMVSRALEVFFSVLGFVGLYFFMRTAIKNEPIRG